METNHPESCRVVFHAAVQFVKWILKYSNIINKVTENKIFLGLQTIKQKTANKCWFKVRLADCFGLIEPFNVKVLLRSSYDLFYLFFPSYLLVRIS